ncbi:MAG: hypothetical protein M0Q51_17060 [Bacteroidales bacterium]|nr:hypothetical protein [Bacteroidales bacterium]
MENQYKIDEFIRKLIRKQGLEKAPDNFTDKVMGRIKDNPVIDDTPLLSTGTWISIIIAVAAIIVVIFTVDIPYFDQIFSATGIQKVSMNVFSEGFFNSMSTFIKGLHISSVTVVIIAAAAGLVVLERLLHRRFSETRLLII